MSSSIQLELSLRLLERRGLNADVVESGVQGCVTFTRTRDALIVLRDGKVNVETLRIILGLMDSSQDLVILVHANPITSDAKTALSKLPHINAFTFDEMAFDLIEIVPHHSLVEYASKPKEWTKFPTLLTSDIVARYYAFKRGDIVQVVEDDETISFKKCV